MNNGNYLVLSDDIIEIDKQNGKVVKRFKLDNNNDVIDIFFDKDNNVVVVRKKDKELYYDYDKLKLIEEKDVVVDIISNNVDIIYGNYYHKFKQNRFGNNKDTSTINTNISLLIN